MGKWIIGLVVVMIVLSMSLTSGCNSGKLNELQALNSKLAAENGESSTHLTVATAEIARLTEKLTSTKARVTELEVANIELSANLTNANAEIARLTSEFNISKNRGDTLQDNILALQDQIDKLQAKVLRNPTHAEAEDFLAIGTNYDFGEYAHHISAQAFINDAKAAGYDCHLVLVYLSNFDRVIYYLVGFKLNNEGKEEWMYVIPDLHREVILIEGKKFHELNDFSKPDFNDTILYFMAF